MSSTSFVFLFVMFLCALRSFRCHQQSESNAKSIVTEVGQYLKLNVIQNQSGVTGGFDGWKWDKSSRMETADV